MKRLILLSIALVLLSFGFAFGGENTLSLEFAWDDTNEKAEGYKWNLYMRGEGEVYDYTTPALVVPYEAGQTEFVAEGSFTVQGIGNSVVTRYFVIRAENAEGVESGDSNEVVHSFKIPMDAPFSFSVQVLVQSEN